MITFKKAFVALLLQLFIISLASSADLSKPTSEIKQVKVFNSEGFKFLDNTETNTDQSSVIAILKNAENYIKKYGKEKAIFEFKKNSAPIFMADYNGNFYLSPLHPELIGTNQFNYKDDSGALPVQEEIEKAKSGGGWLKGRWRKDSKTGKYQCRKIYILPMPGHYFIGSWYHYSPDKQGTCLI